MTLRSWWWQVVAETAFGIGAIPLSIIQLEGLSLVELPATAWLALLGVNVLRTTLWTGFLALPQLRSELQFRRHLDQGAPLSDGELLRIARAAYRYPQLFGAVVAVGFALSQYALIELFPLLTGVEAARPDAAARALMVSAILLGAFVLGSSLSAWLNADLAGEVSLALRARGLAIPGRGPRLRSRILIGGAALVVAPTCWVGSFARIALLRPDGHTDFTVAFMTMAGVLLLWGAVSSWLFSQSISEGIASIAVIVQNIGTTRGRSPLVPVFFRDELGTLSDGVNQMAESVFTFSERIEKFNAELEQRVAERTEQLGAANVELERSLKRLQEMQGKLALSDRLAAVGTLAAGVAHEINNPLAFVNANLEWLEDTLEEPKSIQDPEVAQVLRESLVGVERIRTIVRDLKAFSRLDQADPMGAVDLQQVLDLSVRMAWGELRHRAQLVREHCPIPLVRGNASRLGQVFLNLLINAVQAMPQGQVEQMRVTLVSGEGADGHVFVEVRDTGHGIAPELRKRIFDPFFTTKPVGVGTGLGLSIVHGILDACGATIELESEVGRGTTFRVLLQSAEGIAEEQAHQSVQVLRRTRVLIVDDDPHLAASLQRLLLGDHEVHSVTSGAEALSRLQGGPTIDVIICDVMMPGMSGVELHRALERDQPHLAQRMVFMTAGPMGAPQAKLQGMANPLLTKPLDLAKMRTAIARVLASTAAPRR